MFCGKCGEKQVSGEKFCGNCGEALAASNASSSHSTNTGVAQEVIVKSDPISSVPIANKKISNTHVGMIACAAVGLVAIIVFISILFGGNNPERVAQQYLRTIHNGNYFRATRRYSAFDADDLINVFVADRRMTERQYNERLNESRGYRNIRAFINAQAQEETERLRAEFGRNYSITVEVVSSDELSLREMNSLIDGMRFSYEIRGHEPDSIIRLDRINSIVRVRADITISGSLGHGSTSTTLEVAQIGRRWRVLADSITPLLPIF